jgi:hypothetical protein
MFPSATANENPLDNAELLAREMITEPALEEEEDEDPSPNKITSQKGKSIQRVVCMTSWLNLVRLVSAASAI